MHETAFADATRQTRSVVLNLPLRPYSIGHELALINQRNAMLSPQEDFDALPASDQCRAVISAALICCRSWREQDSPFGRFWYRRFDRANRRADYAVEIAEFRNYRASGTLFPPPPATKADIVCNGEEAEKMGREFGSPYLARLYNFLCGLPPSEIANHGETVFDFPFGLANFLFLSALESEGVLRIQNQKEHETEHELDALIKEIESEKEGK
jgi:hypothetical protein